MSGKFMDKKIRANDVQIGDYIWHLQSYYKVKGVQYGMPEEGFVFIVMEVPGDPGALKLLTVLGDDNIVTARRSGDAEKSKWVEVPNDVVTAMPTVIKLAAETMQNRATRGKMLGLREQRRIEQDLESFVLFALWVAATTDDSGLADLVKGFSR